ncbi:MAG: phosphatase PAP2-related protein [Chitinophagaceae bacterium]
MTFREKLEQYSAVSISLHWKYATAEKKFFAWLIITPAYLIFLVVFLNWFLPYINQRHGIVLPDPLLSALSPVDLSKWIFSILYLSVFTTFVYLIGHPERFLRTLITVALVYSLRMLTLYLVPLDPPAGCVPLADPLMLHLAYNGVIITKDLFFSGHTACMMILVLAVQKKILKILLSTGLIAVIVMLLFQHAHYTIDIMGAIIFTPACWKMSGKILS